MRTAVPALVALAVPVVIASSNASAQPTTTPSPAASASAGAPPPSASASAAPPAPPENKTTGGILPKQVEPGPKKVMFVADPIVDGAAIAMSAGFAGLLELIIGTGEVTPQQPQSADKLIAIDHFAITQTIDPGAGARSSYVLYGVMAYALIDPIATGFRENATAGVTDGVIYAESLSITWAITDLAKIAVRRPRPSAYGEQAQLYQSYCGTATPTPACRNTVPNIADTNSALSFFSGHAATTAAVGATATYLAFARSPNTARPWITLAAAVAASTFVSYERVRAGAHFPTDVIAGTLAGAGVGVLVPHIHREETTKQRPVWVGFQGDVTTSWGLTAGGIF